MPHTLITFPDIPPLPADTITRDQMNQTMNAITKKYYGFILVTCPECGTIIARARYDDAEHRCTNPSCTIEFRASDAPDLFF